VAPPEAAAQAGPLYKPGDRVECDLLAIGTWDAGTVLPYLPTDEPGENFYIHRVRTDKFANLRPEGGFCFTERMRPAAGAAAQRPVVDPRVGEVTVAIRCQPVASGEGSGCPRRQCTGLVVHFGQSRLVQNLHDVQVVMRIFLQLFGALYTWSVRIIKQERGMDGPVIEGQERHSRPDRAGANPIARSRPGPDDADRTQKAGHSLGLGCT